MPTKAHLVKTMVFPVVMYGYVSWTIRKADLQKKKGKLITEEMMLVNCGVREDS